VFGCWLLSSLLVLALLGGAGAWWFHRWILRQYLDPLVRIFTEKPLFIVPRGQPLADAEEVVFANGEGQQLRGCYLPALGPRRQGVILFGLEFGSNRWAAGPYCHFLREAGFDVFTFEPRGQGDSDPQPGYEPLQWVTDHEVRDFQAALAYLKQRPDADPRGVGFFGLSKGGAAGLLAACDDPWVRCFVTDGIFDTYATMVPYMRKWITIYSSRRWLQTLVPDWYYRLVARIALKRVSQERGCRFPHLARRLPRLAPRPWLMIHGEADTYIKPEMALALFACAAEPKECWLVPGAKHNQAFHLAQEEYIQRVRQFFLKHLTQATPLIPVGAAPDSTATAALCRTNGACKGTPERQAPQDIPHSKGQPTHRPAPTRSLC
jgi:pimeloyl-ACP methyl ester carboxylesterase